MDTCFLCAACGKDLMCMQLYMAFIGTHKCSFCGKEVDTGKEKYHVFSKELLNTLEYAGFILKGSGNGTT